jgi:drug/metabolite transporter (DMT)-like permease
MPQLSRQSAFVILPFFLWGTAMVVMKAVIPNTAPLFLAAFRLIPAGILLLGFAIFLGRSQPKGWEAWLWIILFALVDGTLFQGFLAFGLTRTGAGLGSLLIDSQPLAVAVLASFFFGEFISAKTIAGLLIGVLGIGLIGLPAELWQQLGSNHLDGSLFANLITVLQGGVFGVGEWLMLGASLSMAFGTILIRPVVRQTDPLIATAWHMILGGLPLILASTGLENQSWEMLDLWSWLGLGYVTIFGSAIAYGLFFYFASTGSLTTLSALTFSTPIFALLFSSIYLNESLSSVQWLGVVFTLSSIYLVTIIKPDSETAEIPKAMLENPIQHPK